MRAVADDFLDVRSHGFARVAVCVPQVRVAHPTFNADAHLTLLERVHGKGAHYALCPGLVLSADTCGVLFFQETLLRTTLDGLARVMERTARWNLLISVGLPLVVDDLLFNCAVTLYRGRPVAVAPKAYPPNYREFYELRWFHPAADARATELSLLGQRVPFGTDVLVRAGHLPDFVLHTDVCEDLWVPVPPSTIGALSGATVLANLSASNVTVGKWEYRQELVRSSSAKNLAVQLYSAAGFGESTADLAWDGHGLIAERGETVGETERFSLTGNAVTVDVDLRALVADRLRQSSSAQALLVAAHAMDLLGLPRSRIIGVSMPGFGTSRRTYDNACALVRAVGATLREVDIKPIAGELFASIGHDPAVEDLTFENVQAWTRKFLLFSLASQERGIDLGTGDLTELALGFATYGGDHMSHYGVNAGVPKTLVSELIRWAAEKIFKDEPQVAAVLRGILETPISPELLRLGRGGEIAQKAEEIVGPYELHDFFLYYFLRFGFGPRRIARMALHAFEGRYALATIGRWLAVFLERFFANQFKRDCLPDAPKVGSGGSLSPRGDWRMPSDASAAAWRAEAESIPQDVGERRTPAPRTLVEARARERRTGPRRR